MSAKSRNKGAGGEREFAKTLGELVGQPGLLVRNLEQNRNGGDDLQIDTNSKTERFGCQEIINRLDEFSIEIKRHATAKPAAIANWWKQSVAQSQDYSPAKQPMLAYRRDREQWQCIVHISNELPLDDLRGCLMMDINLFSEFLRKGMPHA